ncbi:hypothetical protein RND71_015017 [Anisodus tanguticus]|uniref:ENT domain-containing protein n=1 Tax=Anisodus tanguticus TaxID=243964 RepID=A0AAE1SCJ1_9SOLA|nr:hypothetical protein RND71_015017 [Anisodus tanguticus]
MNKKDSPVSWCPAEIVSGNGHTYSVRYDYYPCTESKMRVERVSRREIRPCPPTLEGVENDESGQIIEGSGTCAKPDQLPAQKPSKKVSMDFSARNGNLKRQKCNASSLVLLKRVSDESSRNIQGDFKRRKIVPSALKGKTHVNIRSKGNMMGEKYVNASFNNWSDGYYGLKPTKRSGANGYSPARIGLSNDSDSDACSVGSCSINHESPNKVSSFSEVHCQVPDLLCSDAVSFESSAEERVEDSCRVSSEKNNVAASIRELELHAYRCTLEALYASGPLSWEQEALLTNLRIALHISNDEHLTELKTLISSGTGIHVS